MKDIDGIWPSCPNGAVHTNMPARVRMTTLYNVAAMIGGRVIIQGNKSEAFVGYTTKYGDLAGDYAVLRDYYVTEVYKIGDALNLPEYLVHKDPLMVWVVRLTQIIWASPYEVLLDDYLMNGNVPRRRCSEKIFWIDTQEIDIRKLIRLPHPECRSRPYLSGTARQKYANDEDCPFSF